MGKNLNGYAVIWYIYSHYPSVRVPPPVLIRHLLYEYFKYNLIITTALNRQWTSWSNAVVKWLTLLHSILEGEVPGSYLELETGYPLNVTTVSFQIIHFHPSILSYTILVTEKALQINYK
jgi:hypothetical protein